MEKSGIKQEKSGKNRDIKKAKKSGQAPPKQQKSGRKIGTEFKSPEIGTNPDKSGLVGALRILS